ncbi:MAG: pilin [bacterium]|nr:pilin [bacterium]
MTQTIKQITGMTLVILAVAVALALAVGVLPVSAQDIENNLCAGANLDVNSNCNTGITDQAASAKINNLIGSIINIFTLVVGVVSVLMIIIGGFKYITSGGDSSNVSGAKNTILYAIIGLVIVALAQTIVRFVLGRVLAA